jgi:hypothetical protein
MAKFNIIVSNNYLIFEDSIMLKNQIITKYAKNISLFFFSKKIFFWKKKNKSNFWRENFNIFHKIIIIIIIIIIIRNLISYGTTCKLAWY